MRLAPLPLRQISSSLCLGWANHSRLFNTGRPIKPHRVYTGAPYLSAVQALFFWATQDGSCWCVTRSVALIGSRGSRLMHIWEWVGWCQAVGRPSVSRLLLSYLPFLYWHFSILYCLLHLHLHLLYCLYSYSSLHLILHFTFALILFLPVEVITLTYRTLHWSTLQ